MSTSTFIIMSGLRVRDRRDGRTGVSRSPARPDGTAVIAWDDGGSELVGVEHLEAVDATPAAPVSLPSAQTADQVAWSKEIIVERIREWHGRFGDTPAMHDWNPSVARTLGHEASVFQAESPHWPHTKIVMKLFGSWNRAILAAGQKPRVGRRPTNPATARSTPVTATAVPAPPAPAPASPPALPEAEVNDAPKEPFSLKAWLDQVPIDELEQHADRLDAELKLATALIDLKRGWEERS